MFACMADAVAAQLKLGYATLEEHDGYRLMRNLVNDEVILLRVGFLTVYSAKVIGRYTTMAKAMCDGNFVTEDHGDNWRLVTNGDKRYLVYDTGFEVIVGVI